MLMRLRIITPITYQNWAAKTTPMLAQRLRPDVAVSQVYLDKGPASIESFYEDAIAAPQVVLRAVQAERDGVDAVIIDCMADPGLQAARETVSIPVVGAAHSSMLLASILAHKFSVISTAARDVYPIELLVRRYGLKDKFASTRWVDIPVLDLKADRDRLLAALTAASVEAIRRDGAHALVFGCTGMIGMASLLEKELAKQHLDAIVIDPTLAALKWAEMLVDLQLAPSRWSYPLLSRSDIQDHSTSPAGPIAEVSGKLALTPEIQVMVPVVQGYREVNWLDSGLKEYASFSRQGTRVQISAIESGPTTIENLYSESIVVPEMLRLIRSAEQNGASAVIIDCMRDPSLDPAREAAGIPVVGPSQSSAFLAASLADRFSYLGTGRGSRQKYSNQMEEYGISGKLASVRSTGFSVQEVETKPQALLKALTEAAESAVIQDGAHILVLGCTGMIGFARQVQDALYAQGIQVPVLDPPAVAIKMAELLSDLELAHSKLTYPLPPKKTLTGYPDLEF
jgi:allantoin racemase